MSDRHSRNALIAASKFLSLVLRHAPERICLTLDGCGWADVAELEKLAGLHGKSLSRTLIEAVVASDDKQRYALSPDGLNIRASQGHSIAVDLGLIARDPPTLLYHGTATRFVESILREGLCKSTRQHVHLSADPAIATRVGQRHGKPLVLTVAAAQMAAAGHRFYLSDNCVWLTDQVPAVFLRALV